MKRTLLYDRDTGRLLHAHYEVRAIEDDAAGARLSGPVAAEPDAILAELVSRGFDVERVGHLTTSTPPQSSRRTERSVDVRTGRLRSRRIDDRDDRDDEEPERTTSTRRKVGDGRVQG